MALPNAYGQYNNSKILTASPAELTLMLYEGAVKFCNIAIVAIENKEIEKAHIHIQKTERIIDYLRQTLDMKYPVAEDFERIYSYLGQRLIEANIKKDKEILEEVNGHLRSVRDTWKALDSGFEKLYAKVSEELGSNREQYGAQIKRLQRLVAEVTEQSMSIQAQEARNKKLVEDFFKKEREGICMGRKTSQAALGYYRTMSKTSVVAPQFMDSKK